MKKLLAAALITLTSLAATADPVQTLQEFVRDVKTGRAGFTQTVTSPDGAKKKTSSGNFEFLRPNRFRFSYTKPFEQMIVGDGAKVWIFDADLNQVSSRKLGAALGATPAALLAGATLDNDFTLSPLPAKDGIDWAAATPKQKDGSFQSLHVGFRGKDLAAVEIVDSFGQRSVLTFSAWVANPPLAAEAFRYTPPKGADVIEQ